MTIKLDLHQCEQTIGWLNYALEQFTEGKRPFTRRIREELAEMYKIRAIFEVELENLYVVEKETVK